MSQSTEMLGMSDDDFLKMDAPPVVEAPASTAVVEEQQQEQVQEPASVQEEVTEQPPVVETQQEPVVETNPLGEEDKSSVEQAPPAKVDPESKDTKVEPVKSEEPAVTTDYKAAYDLLMKPIKANGKEIQLKSPEELIQLAQMGANYTRKMQDIAPHRKTLLMLENNGLLDESKLSFLIDLSKKDPAAIQKFIKESGINPLDIDTDAEPTYKEGNHRVSDEEATFRATLDDLSSSDTGKTTLQVINSTWDQASKELLYTQPGIMEVMHQQREAGFYDRIVGEMDRRKTLGQLPTGQTWLQSYKAVGDQLVAAGAFADLLVKQEQQQQTPPPVVTPVATRVLEPKPKVVPNDKANAAAPSKVAAAQAKSIVNPLAMSDDDFLKQMQNRL